MNASATILRQRLPFLGLFLSAAAGILLSSITWWSSAIFLTGAAAAIIAWLFLERPALVFLAIGLAFGCVHTWQTRESPAWRLAGHLSEGPVLAKVTGTVLSEPLPFGQGRSRLVLRVADLELDGNPVHYPCDIAVTCPDPPPPRGALSRLIGRLEVIPPPRNPGAFDVKAWLRSRGITCRLDVASPADVEVIRLAAWYSPPVLATSSRAWMEKTLREGIENDPVISGLLAGMVLGSTSELPEVLRQEFRNTGTFHLFSVSGLHVGMIGLILWQLLKVTGLGRRRAVAIIIPALFFYALVTGWKPSSIRAAVMATIFLIGLASSRQPTGLNSLGAAGFLILAQWTGELFNPGFQLSFLVVTSILLLAAPLHGAIRRRWHPDSFIPRRLWTRRERLGMETSESVGGLAAVSLAAWTGSLPLTLVYFHLVSFSALLANLVIVPLAFLIMATACAALAGGLLSVWLAAVFNNANWVFLNVLLAIVQAASALPGSHFVLALPPSAPVVVTVFDFGDGGATAIESGGKIWLYDSGPAWQFDQVLSPWLRSRGREGPDAVILSHGDASHIGGAAGFLEQPDPPRIIDSTRDDRSPVRARLQRRLAELGLPKSLVRSGDSLTLPGDLGLEILHPSSNSPGNEADDKVLVMRLTVGKHRVLFLSDAGPVARNRLLEESRDQLAADILVTGIPRSGFPAAEEFLDAVRPALLVTSGASFPASESPDPEWCRRIQASGIRLIRQDVSGAVRMEFFDGEVRVSTFVDQERIRLSREKRPAADGPAALLR